MTSRREFLSRGIALAAAATGLPLSSGKAYAARPEPRDGPCLPPMHVAYDVMQQLAQSGLHLGFPDGTFAGKFPVSRQAFVWALRTLLSQVPYCEGAGIHLSTLRVPSLPPFLRNLAHELAFEFSSQGIREPDLAFALAHFERLCNSPLPRGVGEPVRLPPEAHVVDPHWPINRFARSAGARLAQAEWREGRFCLMQTEPTPDESHFPKAIPLVSMPEAATDPYAGQLLLGHNTEVWRLLRRGGMPSGHRFGWTRDLFRLRSLWTQSGRTPIATRRWHTYVSPDGQAEFDGIRFRSSHRPSRQMFRCEMNDLDYLYSHECLLHSFALMWGEPGTGVAYLRCHGPRGARNPVRLFAIDVRTKVILNAAVA